MAQKRSEIVVDGWNRRTRSRLSLPLGKCKMLSSRWAKVIEFFELVNTF